LSLSYWTDNLGFITEGKLAAIFIKTFSWGFPTGRSFILHQLGPIKVAGVLWEAGRQRCNTEGRCCVVLFATGR
jgi:hypothetical protein